MTDKKTAVGTADEMRIGGKSEVKKKIPIIPPVEAFEGKNPLPPIPDATHTEPTEENRFAEILRSSKIHLGDVYPLPPLALTFSSGDKFLPFGTLGNFSLVTGKAKSKKTFLMCILLAACTGKRVFENTIKCHLGSDKLRKLVFDTEQSKYHVWRTLTRIAKVSGVDSLPDIEVYSLREFTPQERTKVIEYALTEGNPLQDIGIVVIDGIRDLILDINDPKEATDISTKLMRWTTLAHTHIVTVLHQNKGDNNARGHVGTELVNKAESVISVTRDEKNKDISLVAPEDSRDKEFDSFAFGINEEGLPEILADYETTGTGDKKKAFFDPYLIQPTMHHEVLSKVFKVAPSFNRPNIISELKTAWRAYGQNFGDNKARDLVAYYSQMGWMSNEGPAGKPAVYIYKPGGVC